MFELSPRMWKHTDARLSNSIGRPGQVPLQSLASAPSFSTSFLFKSKVEFRGLMSQPAKVPPASCYLVHTFIQVVGPVAEHDSRPRPSRHAHFRTQPSWISASNGGGEMLWAAIFEAMDHVLIPKLPCVEQSRLLLKPRDRILWIYRLSEFEIHEGIMQEWAFCSCLRHSMKHLQALLGSESEEAEKLYTHVVAGRGLAQLVRVQMGHIQTASTRAGWFQAPCSR